MNKLSQINQFTEGMIKDLHPMNTPNNVLTDCLNGTLLTYDGNEFMLQNDMGNYAFKYGSLGSGFVPVGIKEHGGLLYIISYNPILNKVEIGSFPSCKTIFNANTNNENANLIPLLLTDNTINLYSSIQNTSKLVVFNNNENFFLNPGDKYILSIYDENNNNYENLEKVQKILNWQHLTPYILTNENKLYNIDGYIELSSTNLSNREDFKNVKWDIPGYLAAQFNINTPSEFNVYFTKSILNIDEESLQDGIYKVKPSGDIKLQTIWDLNIYKNQIDNISKNISFLFYNDIEDIKDNNLNNNQIYIYNIDQLLSNQYNDQQIILYYTIKTTDENFKTVLKYKYVVPILKTNDNKYIIYDQFSTYINSEEQIIDVSKIKIGDEYFKYYVDTNSTTLYFNFNAYPGCKLKYQLYRYMEGSTLTHVSNDYPVSGSNKDSWAGKWAPVYSKYQELTDINYNGQNVIDLTFTTESDYKLYKYNNLNENDVQLYTDTIQNEVDQNKFSNIYITKNNPYALFYASNINGKTDYYFNNSINGNYIANTFDKEDLYYISFRIYLNINNTDLELKNNNSPIFFNEQIYLSEVTNYFYNIKESFISDDEDSKLTLTEWSNKVSDLISLNIDDTFLSNFDKYYYYNELVYNNNILPVEKGSDLAKTRDTFIENLQDAIKNYANNYTIEDIFWYTNYPSTTYSNSKLYIRDGKTWKFTNDGISLNLYQNQYKKLGRLWRTTNIKGISKDSTFIDSRGKAQFLNFNNKSYTDESKTLYNFSDLSFDINLYNTYIISYSLSLLSKQVASETKRLTDIVNNEWSKYVPQPTYNKDDTGKLSELILNGGLAVYGNQTGDNSIGGFNSNTNNLRIKWENNEFFLYDNLAGTFIKYPNILSKPDGNDLINYYDFRGTESWYIYQDGTDRTKTTWANFTDRTKYSNYPTINICFLWSNTNYGDSKQIISTIEGDRNLGRYYWCLYLPGSQRYCAIYPKEIYSDIQNMFDACVVAISAIYWYVTIVNRVRIANLYFPSFNVELQNIQSSNIKQLNLEAQLDYTYPDSTYQGQGVNKFIAINSIDNSYVYNTLNINKTLDVNLDEKLYNEIVNITDLLNNESNISYNNKLSEKEIQVNDIIIDNSYNESKNIIKLSNLVNNLSYVDNVLQYNSISSYALMFDSNNRNKHKVAYELSEHLT